MSMSTPPNHHTLEIITSGVHLASASVISFCLSRRVPRMSWRSWRRLTWSRLCVILVLLDSWFFVAFSGILMTGIGTFHDIHACSIAICICISIYVLSKVLVYSFLSERIYVVWSGGNQSRRLKTPVYRVCCIVLAGFLVVAIFMVLGRESHIRDDGACVIGLKQSVGIGLVIYDLFLNVFMTVMFLWPLCGLSPSHSGAKSSPKLRKLAKRTFCGATISLIVSATNISILSALGGNELGWVCMSSCVSDVVINSVVLYWISAPSGSDKREGDVSQDRYSLPTMDLSVLSTTAVPHSLVEAEGSRHQVNSAGNGIGSTKAKGLDQPAEVTLPEEFFDYIPKEHLGWRRSDDDDYEGAHSGEGQKNAERSNPEAVVVKHEVTQKSDVIDRIV